MTKQALLEKIESLPPEKQAEAERFVDALAARKGERETPSGPRREAFPRELLDKINADREALFREHGSIETDSILRDLRENGGR